MGWLDSLLLGGCMPRLILFAAGALGTCLVAACAQGPRAATLSQGLAYDCTPGGEASIAFSGGGYLPESKVWAGEKDARAQVWRSTADLVFAGDEHRMIAEWSVEGLRYRSAEPYDGSDYLVWTVRSAGTRGAEDARLGRRPGADPEGEEEHDAGALVADCRRRGRDPVAGTPAPDSEPAHEEHEAGASQEAPHLP